MAHGTSNIAIAPLLSNNIGVSSVLATSGFDFSTAINGSITVNSVAQVQVSFTHKVTANILLNGYIVPEEDLHYLELGSGGLLLNEDGSFIMKEIGL